MKHTIPFAAFFIACCALSTGAQSQNVYRCGDTYSQKPCADAVVIDVGDPRSPAQKAQADAETRRELAAANAMEKARLKEEAQMRSDRAKLASSQAKKTATPAQSAASAAAASHTGAAVKKTNKSHAKKKKEPEFFTAHSAAPKPKAPASSTR
jgi:alpha-D-ribose 1-methylphosphonate 5-triphosphate diphosphatase PhnM